MKIQAINLSTTNQNFQSKLRKVPPQLKPKMDSVKEMNRNFTIAAIITLLFEVGMVTTYALTHKHSQEAKQQKKEQVVIDAQLSSQNILYRE